MFSYVNGILGLCFNNSLIFIHGMWRQYAPYNVMYVCTFVSNCLLYADV